MNTNELIELTPETAKSIIATLPVSLYLKQGSTDLKIDLTTTKSTSFFKPSQNKIMIAYSNLQSIADKHNGKLTESNIRGLVYHEVSHAILTDDWSWSTWLSNFGTNDEINIFEDERIETIAQHWFLGVDFWKNRLEILGKPEKAKTREQYYFNVTRLHYTEGHPELVDMLKELIEVTSHETRFENITINEMKLIRDYIDSCYKIFDEKKQKQESKQEDKSGVSDNTESKESASSNEKEESAESNMEGSEETEETTEEPEPLENPLSDKELDNKIAKISSQMVKEVNSRHPLLSTFKENTSTTIDFLKVLASAGAFGVEDSFTQSGYVGDFEPEEKMLDFGNEKKWWVDSNDEGNHSQQDEKLVLNLWIDNSGSYSANDKATNEILKSLAEIERKLPKFKFNFIKVDERFIIKTGNERISHSSGGNALPKEEIEKCYKETHKTGNERDIVLFDGKVGYEQVFIEANFIKDKEKEAISKAFSYNNLQCLNKSTTTFITEYSNTEAIKEVCPNAVTIEENYNYSRALKNNIIKALRRMF